MLRLLQNLLGYSDSSGDRGEQLAAAWLKRERGFEIVARNWRNPSDRRDEIDLVGKDGEVLVFVEVKARAAGALVPGYHAIDARKKRALRRAIEAYLAKLQPKPNTFRFDVVEVSFPAAEKTLAKTTTAKTNTEAKAKAREGEPAPEILHFENVPLFSKYFRG